MVQARPFEIDDVVVPGHYVIIADDVVLLQADYNIVAMKRDGKMYADTLYSAPRPSAVIAFLGAGRIWNDEDVILTDLNNGDLIR